LDTKISDYDIFSESTDRSVEENNESLEESISSIRPNKRKNSYNIETNK